MTIRLIWLMRVMFHLHSPNFLKWLCLCLKGSRSVLTTSFCGNKLIDRFDTSIVSRSSAALSKTVSLRISSDHCQGLDIPLCAGTCGSLALIIPILCSYSFLSKLSLPATQDVLELNVETCLTISLREALHKFFCPETRITPLFLPDWLASVPIFHRTWFSC